MRIQWTDQLRKELVLKAVKLLNLGRMPTVSEFRKLEFGNALVSSLVREGGLDFWADKLSLSKAGSCSRKGWKWEDHFAIECGGRNISIEKRSKLKDPYDLIANGHKIDVKCATPSNHFGALRQWTFGIRRGNQAHTVDFYALYCLNGIDEVEGLYIVPSDAASHSYLTITDSKRGRYRGFMGRWDQLA